jgi:hypothetical protein
VAFAPEGMDSSATWSVEEPGGGSIDPRGNYVASSKTGTFHVVATSHLHPGATARAEVQVVQLPAPAGSGTCPDTAVPAGWCNGPYCWDYPAPFGMDLTAAAVSGEDLWAGGNSVLLRRKGSAWTRFDAPGPISMLWADDPPGVDLFGLVKGKGIFRFDGTSWTASLPGAVDRMAVVSRSQAYAIERETILGWDGQTWTERFRASSPLRDIWAGGPADVLAVGGPIAVHFDGSGWTETAHGLTMTVPVGPFGNTTTEPLRLERILGRTGDEVWVEDGSGGRAAYAGSTWTLLQSACPGCGAGAPVGLFSPVPGDTWVAVDFMALGGPDADGYWFEHDSGNSRAGLEVDRRIEAMAGGYAVGASASVWKFEQGTWTKQTGGAGSAVESLWIDDCGRGLAFLSRGYRWSGLALRKEGSAGWVRDDGDPDTESFWAASFDDAWASGFGSLWHRDRAGWSRALRLEGEEGAMVLGGSGPDDVWAIGNSVWHWDGSQWTERPLPSSGPLSGFAGAIWAHARNDVWALRGSFPAASETLWHWDGNGWSSVDAPPGLTITALSGDDDGVVAAGVDASHRAALFRRAGNAWVGSLVPDDAFTWQVSLSKLPGGDFGLVVPNDGTAVAFRWDGVKFTRIPAPLDSPYLTAVAGDRSGHLWVGTGGGIFQVAP